MMKIQSLAIIAIIILLPMTLILSTYISSQAKTLSYQVEYDARLQNSTYDALKAFQMNTANSDTSDIANSKIRDVKAGANSFFDSLANNFNMPGYDRDTLSEYVPAVVFTMYDGYYIYAPYTNTLDTLNQNIGENGEEKGTDAEILDEKREDDYKTEDGEEVGAQDIRYYDKQDLKGLKPYVYYSARYNYNGADITITYSLDNYIVIHGEKDNKAIDISGYLLTDVGYDDSNNVSNGKPGINSTATYRGVTIDAETESKGTGISENVYLSGETFDAALGATPGDANVEKRLVQPCRMINGVRYYEIRGENGIDTHTVWAMLNGSWRQQNYPSYTEEIRQRLDATKVKTKDVIVNTNALEYFQDAVNFKDEIASFGLQNLTIGDMIINYIGDDGNVKDIKYKDYCDLYRDEKNDSISLSYLGDPTKSIFDGLGSTSNGQVFPNEGNNVTIEEKQSNFNVHRLGVIRYSIEKNLSVAINNFNVYSTSSTDFEMPKLDEEEWDLIYDNVCIMTFLQGLSIGGKIYSGHSVVPNTDNKEVVKEDSIYIVGNNNKVYKPTYSDLSVFGGINSAKARWKMDFKRSATEDLTTGVVNYFYRYPEDVKTGDTWFAYDSIVTPEKNNATDNMYQYIDNCGDDNLKKVYYTALARVRWGMYRVENENFLTAYDANGLDITNFTY